MRNGLKEKIIVFRHLRYFAFKIDSLTDEEAKRQIIEQELTRGYLLLDKITFKTVKPFDLARIKQREPYRSGTYYAGYAGKRFARDYYEKNGLPKGPMDKVRILGL